MKLFVLLIVLAAAGTGRAQQAAPVALPADPLITAHMPASSSWSANYLYAGAEKDEAALSKSYAEAVRQRASSDPTLARAIAADPGLLIRPSNVKQRIVTKAGDVRSEVSLYTNGSRGETWYFGAKMVTRNATTQRFSVESSIPAKDEPDLPEFTWINRQNFTGVQTIDGRKCLVFVAKIDPMQVENPRLFATTSGSGDPDAKVPVTALIDFETRLPVSIAYRNLTMTYQILAAPAGGLAVPPEFVAAAQELDRRIKIRNAPLSPP